MLTPGLEFGVDEVKATTYPFHHCRSEGCLAIFPISKKLRKNLELGKQANIGYCLTNGKKYRIPVSLIGITAGIKSAEKYGERYEERQVATLKLTTTRRDAVVRGLSRPE